MSPFQPTSEGFTVREISILIPPHFIRQNSLPADQIVNLPTENLQASFQMGRPALRLSQIAAACPDLFQRQITSAEDMEVVLPYQKVRRMLENPHLHTRTVGDQSASPFLQRSSPFVAVEANEALPAASPAVVSPFSLASPARGLAPASPFSIAAATPVESVFRETPAPPPANREMASTHPASSPFSVAVRSPFQEGPPQLAASVPHSTSPFAISQDASILRQAENPAPLVGTAIVGNSPFEIAAAAPGPFRPPAVPAPGAASPFKVQGEGPPQSMGAPFQMAAQQRTELPVQGIIPPPHSTSPFQLAAEMRPPPQAVPSGAPASYPGQPPRTQSHQETPTALQPPSEAISHREVPLGHGSVPYLENVQSRPASAPIVVRTEPPVPGRPSVAEVSTPQAASQEETISLSLAGVLRGVNGRDLGFDPANVPSAVRVEIPLSAVRSQLATGKVVVPIDMVESGVLEKFRPAFARARRDLQLALPLSEVFQALPPSAIPSAPAPAAAPMNPEFATPFSTLAREDAAKPPHPAAPSAVAEPTLPPLLVNRRPSVQVESAPTPPPAEFPGQPTLGLSSKSLELPSVAPLPNSRPAEAPSLAPFQENEDLGLPMRAETLSEAPPDDFRPRQPNMPPRPVAEAPPLAVPAAPQPMEPEMRPVVVPAPAALPSPEPQPPAPVPVTPLAPLLAPAAAPISASSQPPLPQRVAPVSQPEDLTFGYQEDARQIALRAIFNTERTLAPQEVVDLSVKFPGIRACVIITAAGITYSGRTEESEEVYNFSTSASQSHHYLTCLAESLQMASSGTFTLRSDKSVRSFFMEQGVCLAVLHAEPAFRPGVREKLTLVTRELAAMLA